MRFLRSIESTTSPFLALAVGALLTVSAAYADVSFTAKRMTRDDVPSGKGQCDIRFRVDNEVELAVRGDQVQIRALAGRESRDEGSECNFPLPVGQINNFRWEKRDGRGRVELLEEPSRRSGNRAIFNIRDSDGGDDRYHIRINWDISGSSNISGGRPSRGDSSTGNRGGGNRGAGNRGASSSDSTWGNSNASGWGNTGNSNASGWGTGSNNGWGNVNPPARLNANGRGTVKWDGRADLTISRADVTVSGDRATIRFQTTANRTVELRGRVTDSSNGFFEVDLDGSSEGNVDGMARVDYRNTSSLDRVDAYGNAGNTRFRFDFRR